MDHLHRISRPRLRNPAAVMAWEGWNDAGEAASGAVAYLLDLADGPEPFATIEPEEFYDFQAHRPTVAVDEGGTRRLTWPVTTAHCCPLGSRDLVVVAGDEPNLRWKTYTRTL